MVTMREFTRTLNGREYACCMFTKQEIQLAKDNGWIIVTGASDDLMEFEGALCTESGCYNGGKVFFSKYGLNDGKFLNCIEAVWCGEEALDENGNVIPWIYKTDIPHETFMIYEEGNPYCRGIVLSVSDLK